MAGTPETPIPAPVTNFPNTKCIEYTEVDDWSACTIEGLPVSIPGATGCTYSCWIYSSNYAYRSGMKILDLSIFVSGVHLISTYELMFSGTTSQLLYREGEVDVDLDPTPLSINVWHHICVTSTSTTASGGTAILYVDGVSVASGAGSALTAVATDILVSDGLSAFSGKVDEVAIWNAPLTAAQVSTLYNGGKASDINNIASSNLKIWWRMGGGDDTGGPSGEIYNVASPPLGLPGFPPLPILAPANPASEPEIVDGGPPSYNRFQVTTPENSGTGLIPRVLNQKSVTLDGVNQSYSSTIGVGPDFTVGGNGMTLNCNVKLNSVTGLQPIFGQANIDSTGTHTAFMIYMFNATLTVIAADSASGDWAIMGIVAPLVTGVWYTVTVTLAPGGNMIGYLWGTQYGTPVAISAGFGATWSANKCWSIGAWREGTVPNPPLTNFSNIQVDECTVFNLAMSQLGIIRANSKIYYRPDWSTPPVDYMTEFEGKLGYPLAWWRMGDTAGDSATKMFDATKFANAYSIALDGTNDYVDSEAIPVTELDGATSFSFWAKVDATNSQEMVMSLGTSSSGTRMRYSIDHNYAQWRLLNGSGYAGAGQQQYTLNNPGDPAVTTGWHHIVFADTATDSATGVCKVYIDGSEVHEFNPSRQWAGSPYAPTFVRASAAYNGGISLEGNVDEIALWERTLSPSEVTDDIFNGGEPTDLSALSAGGPTHWWRMGDKVSGVTLPDQGSGTALDMTLINGATIAGDVPSAGASNTLTGSGLSASDIQDEIPIIYFGAASQNAVGGPYFAAPTIITPIQVPYVNPVPLLASSSPPSGPLAGGTTITITGINLNGVISVVVGGVFLRKSYFCKCYLNYSGNFS